MRHTIKEKKNILGFHLVKRKSRRTPPSTITDLDFADDIALITQEITQAQEMMKLVETNAYKIGLGINM